MVGFIIGLSIAFTIFIITSIVVCIRRKQKAAKSVGYVINPDGAPVVVTSATHTAPGGYPVTQIGQTSYMATPANVYAPAPYPAQTTGNVTVQMPMPMPQHPGMPPQGAGYPPMPQPNQMNPPSYDMAVAYPGPSVIPPSAGYEKQAPYNPSYGQ